MSLTEQLAEWDAHLLPTAAQWEQKEWVECTLKPLLERHTGGELHYFGSCENGFWTSGSDVDACLVLRRCAQKQAWITKLRLVQSLVERDRFGTVQLVTAARVPVAKVLCSAGDELCDISVNNVAALENSRFVGTLAKLDPRIPTLGRFIKHWASQRRINNRSEGTMSTYTLILQLYYFLQTRETPILPRVCDLLTDSAVAAREEFLAAGERAAAATAAGGAEIVTRAANAFAKEEELDVATGRLRPLPFVTEADAIREPNRFPGLGENLQSSGELLHDFFGLWGREDFSGRDGTGRTVFVYDASCEENDSGVLVMRCPLTGKNVNPFTPTVWRAIHAEFARADALLTQSRSLAELCEPVEDTMGRRSLRA